jgi:hypothetical protein
MAENTADIVVVPENHYIEFFPRETRSNVMLNGRGWMYATETYKGGKNITTFDSQNLPNGLKVIDCGFGYGEGLDDITYIVYNPDAVDIVDFSSRELRSQKEAPVLLWKEYEQQGYVKLDHTNDKNILVRTKLHSVVYPDTIRQDSSLQPLIREMEKFSVRS